LESVESGEQRAWKGKSRRCGKGRIGGGNDGGRGNGGQEAWKGQDRMAWK